VEAKVDPVHERSATHDRFRRRWSEIGEWRAVNVGSDRSLRVGSTTILFSPSLRTNKQRCDFLKGGQFREKSDSSMVVALMLFDLS
jgi:hypothetical protein